MRQDPSRRRLSTRCRLGAKPGIGELANGLAAVPKPIMINPCRPVFQMRASVLVRWISAITAVSIAGLLACEESPRTTTTRQVENPWAFVQPAMAIGPLLVLVRGLPSPAQETAIEDAVLDAARKAVTWTATPRFTLLPAEAGSTVLRLVYVFNGQPSADPCAYEVPGGTWQQGGRVVLMAAICDDSSMLARVEGLLKRHEGVDDPRFGRLVTQATRELLAPPPAPRP
jgi:hypothetical protein